MYNHRESDKRLYLIIFIIALIFSMLFLFIYLYEKNEINFYFLKTKYYSIGLNDEEKRKYLDSLYKREDFNAIKDFLEKNSFSSLSKIEKYSMLASAYEQTKDYKKACNYYEKLFNESDSEEYMFKHAECLYRNNKKDEALNLHYRIFFINDSYIDNVQEILKILLEQKKFDEGISLIETYADKYEFAIDYLEYYKHKFKSSYGKKNNKIKLTENNGHFKTNVQINDNKKLYIYLLDTGASITSINKKIYNENLNDIKKTGKKLKAIDANGDIEIVDEVIINKISINGIELKNVIGFIKNNGENLLGQNVLKNLKIKMRKENGLHVMYLEK